MSNEKAIKPRPTRNGIPFRHGFKRHPEDMSRTGRHTLYGVGTIERLVLRPELVQISIRCGNILIALDSAHPGAYLDATLVLDSTPIGTRVKFEALPIRMENGVIHVSVLRPTSKDVFGRDEALLKLTGLDPKGRALSGRLQFDLPADLAGAEAVALTWTGEHLVCQPVPSGVVL